MVYPLGKIENNRTMCVALAAIRFIASKYQCVNTPSFYSYPQY